MDCVALGSSHQLGRFFPVGDHFPSSGDALMVEPAQPQAQPLPSPARDRLSHVG